MVSRGNLSSGLDKTEELEAKGLIIDVIRTVIASRQLTQTQAAELFSMKQPNVSRLLNDRLKGCSFDRLFDLLNLLQQDVEIVVKPHLGDGAGKVKVTTVLSRRRQAPTGRP